MDLHDLKSHIDARFDSVEAKADRIETKIDDATGSSPSMHVLVGEVEVYYYGFLTPPEIEVS